MRKLFTLLFFALTYVLGITQSIFSNTITGTNPNTSNPYTAGQVVDPDLIVSGIGRGSGITGTNANDRYNANSWNSPTFDATDYFTWTITPDATHALEFSSFVYTGQTSPTGPTNFAFRSSVDGFSNNYGAPTNSGATIDLTAPQFKSLYAPIEFRLYAWGASASGGTFSVNDFTFNGITPLPVSFSKFDVVKDDKANVLLFTTASETNNHFFTIERSKDGVSFEEIGQLKGAGNSVGFIDYKFRDENPLVGYNYYRIKQTDYDGQYSYSAIKSILSGGKNTVRVTPQTTEGRFSIFSDKEQYQVAIYSTNGQLVRNFPNLSYDQELTIDDVKSGVYYLQINDEYETETIKIVKL